MKSIRSVCLAANDVASVYKDFRRAFEGLGIEVITYVDQLPKSRIIQQDTYNYWGNKLVPKWFRDQYFSPKNKKVRSLYARVCKLLNDLSVFLQFRKIIREADVIIFFYNSFYEDSRDLELIKKAGKKVVYIFVGDDARWYYGMKQDFLLNGLDAYDYGDDYDYSVDGLLHRIRKIRSAEKFADVVFSKREQSQLQIRGFYHYPMVVHPDDYLPDYRQREKCPRVVHAPSNPSIKGTAHVLAAFERLRQEGVEFEPVLIQNMPHSEAKRVYQDADIVIDQLFIPGAGKLASEAMAMGKVVLGRMAYDKYQQGFPIEDCPIVDAGPDTIYETLKRIIEDYPLRKKLGQRGREYVLKYLDVRSVTKKILNLCEGQHLPFDHVPEFFMRNYRPESAEARDILNQWLQPVKGEDWYLAALKDRDTSDEFNF